MNESKNLLIHLGEALERYRAERSSATPPESTSPPEGARPRNFWDFARRWLLPNPGTLILVIALLFSVPALARNAAAPSATSVTTIPYQGRLADINGNPVTDRVNMEFRLYNVPTGGTPLWEEFWTGGNAVNVSDGLFSVMLGSINTNLVQTVQGHETLYLGITIGTDSEMSPRVQLGSVPFSVWSLTVADGSITTDKIADGAVTDAKLSSSFLQLLGYKNCNICGTPSEQGTASTWLPVKGTDTNDIIEVTVTTHGQPVLVQMTSRYRRDVSTIPWCGIAVLSGGNLVRFAHLDGDYLDGTPRGSTDSGCSSSYLFPDLPAGTYTFQARGWVSDDTTVTWTFQRQIVVYEFSSNGQ